LSTLKTIALFLTSPVNLSMLLFLISTLFLLLKYRTWSKVARNAGIVILLIFSQPYSADLLLYPLEHSFTNNQHIKISNSDDYIIYTPACYYSSVGNIPEIARWSECSMQRLTQSAIISKKNNVAIILSGGNFLSDNSVYYAEKAKMYLESLGVDNNLILTSNKGFDTKTEIQSINHLILGKKILLISSATHIQRTRKLLLVNAADVDILAVDFQSSGLLKPYISLPTANALEKSRKALYEYGAIAKNTIFEN
jgi:uncharacterized SAM-binding protein YcdF (DUF218 family)